MSIETIAILFFGALILLCGVVVIWVIQRRYRRQLGMEKDAREKSTETAFIIAAFHDVTKKLKEKEKELERLKSLAEQRAETVASYNENILQCVTNGVMAFDRECRLITINRAAEEILGVERTALLGTSCESVFGAAGMLDSIRGTLEKKMPSARMEVKLERATGRLWLGYNTAVLTDHQGAPIGVILSFSDLTEVKRLQEQMELRERLTALGEMSAGIAHELRNPMAVISGYLNLLQKKADTGSKEIIRDITTEIAVMNRIIGDLLTFARPASLNRTKTDVKEMLVTCLANVLQATETTERVTAETHIEEAEAYVDEVLMRQAFTNLIQNAVESIQGTGTIFIETQATKSELKILIRDTGDGFPPEMLKKIFLPFYTTKDKGTGLGLAIVHKIILSHGGRIEAESVPGKGSTFRVIVPKA